MLNIRSDVCSKQYGRDAGFAHRRHSGVDTTRSAGARTGRVDDTRESRISRSDLEFKSQSHRNVVDEIIKAADITISKDNGRAMG